LAKAQAEIVQLSNSNRDLQQRLEELSELSSGLDAKTKSDAATLAATQTELEEIKRLAADTITLNERHRALLNDHQLLQNKANVLTAQVEQYKYNDKQKWFIYGALAVLIGVVITLLVPVLKPQKRKSEWLN
jgi:SH3 domain protein